MRDITITEPDPKQPDVILRKSAVATWLGVSPSTIDRWTKAGLFPPGIRLGPARVGWSRERIQEWIATR